MPATWSAGNGAIRLPPVMALGSMVNTPGAAWAEPMAADASSAAAATDSGQGLASHCSR